MKSIKPDYKNILNIIRNIEPERQPLYEHIIDVKIMEKIMDKKFLYLYDGDLKDKRQFFKYYTEFFLKMGYDTVSFECGIPAVLPDSGALNSNAPPAIKGRDDFNDYPWKEIPDNYFKKYSIYFELLGEEMPEGLLAIGGPGNGVFECVQDIVGLENLCLIAIDDPDLYGQLFSRMGTVLFKIWKTFLERYSGIYAVCRFGDDLGYKSSTMLNPLDIKTLLIPQYKKIIDLVHSHQKPFLLHSCGNIFDVMDALIDEAGIDAKHSNEDQIAPFSNWLEKYSDRIALFGGADMSFICTATESGVKDYIKEILSGIKEYRRFAFGTGNSIADYVPVENYLKMIEVFKEFNF